MQNEIEVNPEIVSAETNFIPDAEKYNSGNVVPFVSIVKPNTEPEYQYIEIQNKEFIVPDMYFGYPEFNQYIDFDSGYYFDHGQYYVDVPGSNMIECSNISYERNVNCPDGTLKLKGNSNEYLNRIEKLESENEILSRKVSFSEKIFKRNNSEYEILREENERLRRENKKLLEEVFTINKKVDDLHRMKRNLQMECDRKESLIRDFKKNMPFKGSSYKRPRVNKKEIPEKRYFIQYSNSDLKREVGEDFREFDSDSNYKRKKIVYDD